MSVATRLQELHARSHYQSGVGMAESLAVQQDACIKAASLLPEIAAVIAAAEKSLRYHNMDDRFAIEAYTQTHNALAALARKLGQP